MKSTSPRLAVNENICLPVRVETSSRSAAVKDGRSSHGVVPLKLPGTVQVVILLFFGLLFSVCTSGVVAYPTEVADVFCGDKAHPTRSSGPHGEPIVSPVSILIFSHVTTQTNNTQAKRPSSWKRRSETVQYNDGECVGIVLTHDEESLMILTTSQGMFLEQGIDLSGDTKSRPGTGCSGKRYNVLFPNISHHVIWCAPVTREEDSSVFRITAASGQSSSFKQWSFTLRRNESSQGDHQQLVAHEERALRVNFAVLMISAVLFVSLCACVFFIAARKRKCIKLSFAYEKFADEDGSEVPSTALKNTLSGSKGVEMVQTSYL